MPDDGLSETQAADVLRRAALLQARSEHTTGMGLSLNELKHAAKAAGIEGQYVEQAYLGAGEDVAPSEPFLGIATGVQRARVVHGDVSEHEWGQMVLALRREFGADGTAETLGGVRTWKHYQTRVQLETDGSSTRIVAQSEWGNDVKVPLYVSVFYAACAAVMVGLSALGGKDVGLGIAMCLLVIGLLHAAFPFGPVRKRSRTRGPQLDRALDVLERLASADERADVLASAPPAPEASGAAQLDPSLLDTGTPSGAPTSRQRLRE